MKKIILITLILTAIGHASTFIEGWNAAENEIRENRLQRQRDIQYQQQQEMMTLRRERLRQEILLNEAKIRAINARREQVGVGQNKRSVLRYKNNSSKYFTSEKGTRFRVVYNKHGAILKSKSFTIYLGKSCDTSSPEFGTGTWKDGRHMGFSIQFNNKEIVFPKQQISIKNNAKCI